MNVNEIIDQLDASPLADRLAVIEAAARSVRRELAAGVPHRAYSEAEEPLAPLIGCLDGPGMTSDEIDEELYGPVTVPES